MQQVLLTMGDKITFLNRTVKDLIQSAIVLQSCLASLQFKTYFVIMHHLGAVILTLFCLVLNADGIGVSDTNLANIVKKLEALEGNIEGKLEALESKIDNKWNTLNKRIAKIEGKSNDGVDNDKKIEGKLEVLESKIEMKWDGLNKRIEQIEEKNNDATIDVNAETIDNKLATLKSYIDQKFNVMSERIDSTIENIEKKNIDAIMNVNDESDKMIGEQTESDKRMTKMNGVINNVKANVQNLNKPKEKKQMKVARNSTDLEERVSELEDKMAVIQIGLSAVADNVDELQEADALHDETILYLEKEVDQIEDNANGMAYFYLKILILSKILITLHKCCIYPGYSVFLQHKLHQAIYEPLIP